MRLPDLSLWRGRELAGSELAQLAGRGSLTYISHITFFDLQKLPRVISSDRFIDSFIEFRRKRFARLSVGYLKHNGSPF